jgi:hypothetical protein
MKKRLKKLGLHRETLRNLQHHQLSRGVGASDLDTSCACHGLTGCDCYTQDAGCTTPPSAAFATCSPC